MSQSETIVGLGARTDYLAQVPNVDPSRLRLTPEEDQLYSAVGRAARIDEVIQRSGMAEPRAIAVLLSLRAKGAVVPARVQKPSGVTVDAAMSEEVDLQPERKKEILDLERGLEKLNAFELLGLMPGATVDEVRQAYYAASKRYHPDRYYGKNLGSFKYRIDKIFKKLTDAYNTLSDDDRRAEYLRKHPELAPVAAPPPPAANGTSSAAAHPQDSARLSERRARMARHPYLVRNTRITELVNRAKEHIQKGTPGLALTDLHLAQQLDPENKEIQFLQSEARRKNDVLRAATEVQKGAEAEAMGDLPAAMGRYKTAAAVDVANARAAFKAAQLMLQLGGDAKDLRTFAQRAVDLEPKNVEAKVVLGMVLVEADMKKLAKRQFEEVLQLKPDHAEAKKQLKKLRWPF